MKFYADFLQLYSYLSAISDIQFACYFFSKLVKAVRAVFRFRTCVILGLLTIFMEKPEILVGKSNSSCHSVWEALDCKTVGLFLKISKKSVKRGVRVSPAKEKSVSPQSRSLFSASF